MAIDSIKLINLAARGIPQTHIAKALGITDSAVSQLLARDDVQGKVREMEAELASKDLDELISLEKINVSLRGKIGDLVEETDSLGEAVTALEKITKMQNQKRSGNVDTDEGIRKITITIPIFLQQSLQISTSSKNEIIDINNRSMATMPTLSVHKLIKDTRNATDPNTDTINLDAVNF